MEDLRAACAAVAETARFVRVVPARIPAYAAALPPAPGCRADPLSPLLSAREVAAAHWLTLDAINFGSGWFPTLRKRPGRSGYNTIAAALRDRFTARGPWSPSDLMQMSADAIADVLGQDRGHELMALFAGSLRDLGRHVAEEHDGRFLAVVEAAHGSAVDLARRLGAWACFEDTSSLDGWALPFLKRAQIATADLARAGAASFCDLERLTMFADNLVPHVLRLDGVLAFEPGLVGRIAREELIEHGSREEVEIRACAVHAVELLVHARTDLTAAQIDQILWQRGGEPRYKAQARHRSRCTAY